MNYREVAAALGLDPKGTSVAMSTGRIPARLIAGRLDATPEDVEIYRRERLGKFRLQDPAARFWPKVAKSDGCWLWTGSKTKLGYGMFSIDWRSNSRAMAHRWAWENANGPIPDGLQLDHLCRNPSCVRPEHLEPVTAAENIRRGLAPALSGKYQLRKTHCPQGHPYAGDNLVRSGNRRVCRICRNANNRKHYWSHR